MIIGSIALLFGLLFWQQADVLSLQASLAAGDLDGVSRKLQEAMRRNPSDGGLFNLRGIVHARRDEMALARSDFETAVRLAPALTPAWQNLARVCQQTSAMACAIEAWRQVLRAKPGDNEAHVSLAVLRAIKLSWSGRTIEAKTAAAMLAKEPGFTEADLDRFGDTLAQPQSALVTVELISGLDARGAAGVASLRQLVLAYEQLKRPSDALSTLNRIAQTEPNNVSDLLEMARISDSEKRYQEALGYLAHARDLDPNNARIHFLFGLIAGELNLPLEAKRSIEKALSIEPENASYNYALGLVILKTRDAASAATYLQKFVRLRPEDSNGHYALGLAYFASGDYEKAKEEMKIIQRRPDMRGAAEYYLGRIAVINDELDEASSLLHRSVRDIPNFSESHTELAKIAIRKHDLLGAQAELTQALRLQPDSYQANQQLLLLYLRTHDPRKEPQAELLKRLDEDRSKRMELMLRNIEVQP